MIEKIISYKAVCDGCKRVFSDDYSDKDSLQKDMEELGWINIGGEKILCSVCKDEEKRFLELGDEEDQVE